MAGKEGGDVTRESAFILQVDLRQMSEADLLNFICGPLLEIERKKYTGGNTAEHKLLFLIGGPEKDVAVAKTNSGNLVYTSAPAHPKAPEIAEATAVISSHFEVERNIPRVLSEVADIFYNLVHLSMLDSRFSEIYKDCSKRLAKSLGLSLQEALLITAAKYKYRHIDKKSKAPKEEDEVIAQLISEAGEPGKIKAPSDKNITAAYQEINRIENYVLRPSLMQWRFMNSPQQD